MGTTYPQPSKGSSLTWGVNKNSVLPSLINCVNENFLNVLFCYPSWMVQTMSQQHFGRGHFHRASLWAWLLLTWPLPPPPAQPHFLLLPLPGSFWCCHFSPPTGFHVGSPPATKKTQKTLLQKCCQSALTLKCHSMSLSSTGWIKWLCAPDPSIKLSV